MKKLTLYKKTLEVFKTTPELHNGFCNAITHVLLELEGLNYEQLFYEDVRLFDTFWDKAEDIVYGRNSRYRELVKYEPKEHRIFWFDPEDSQTRINILEEIISDLIAKGETE